MNALLFAVLLILVVVVFYYAVQQPEHMEHEVSVDMIDFKYDDPKKAKYTRQWDRDEWGLNSSEKYYENLVYFNNGMSGFDPAGPLMFDDPAGAPPLPGMSEVERLGYEVLGDQNILSNGLSFAPPKTEGTMEELT